MPCSVSSEHFLARIIEDEELLRSSTGLMPSDARDIFEKYCGPTTPIKKMTDLLEIFYFFKVYPTKRQMRLNYFGSHSTSHVMQRIKERARYLALCMTDVQIAFAQRFEATNVLPHLFPSFVTSVYDSFPIVVQRPRRRSLRRLVYCGKYKLCVLKVQVAVSHAGVPIWYSGPHLPRHDRSALSSFAHLFHVPFVW